MLDLFAVPDDVRDLPGGQGRSVVAGDLVLSPGRDPVLLDWLNPVLARLAVTLDRELVAAAAPGRRRRVGGVVATAAVEGAVRIAMPIPARDGSWVVDDWAASRYEPDTTVCADLDVLVAVGRVFHARLRSALERCPSSLAERTDRWARAERLVFGDPLALLRADLGAAGELVSRLVDDLEDLDDTDLGPDQLVHGDLAGNVLLDAAGTPVVIDVAPYWRPAAWAEAVCVVDTVARGGAPLSALAGWRDGAARQAMLRAILFRLLSDDPGADAVERYAALLSPL